MISRQQLYWNYLEPQISRVLSQLDRRPFTATYGCFDRKFWHQRITDFPSASLQQGIEVVAQLYQISESEIKKKQLLEWIEAAVFYTRKIQKWDGSFDEWYFNERGWAGPTAYIMNSLYEAYTLTGVHWSYDTKVAFQKILKNGARSLSRFEESDVLANHQALAMLAMYQSYDVLKTERIFQEYQNIKNRFLKGFCQKEGWSLEYDGADPGYQTATISFLARLHNLNNDPEIQKWVEPQLNFISYFVFPDGTFTRGLGSRSTSVIFFYGLEYWAQYFNLAGKMAQVLLISLVEEKVLGSHQQEDHYLLYRIPELLKAKSIATEQTAKTTLPFEAPVLEKEFEKSGHIFKTHKGLTLVVDSRFGGRYLVWDRKQKMLLHQSSDLFVTNGGKTSTTGHCGASIRVTDGGIEIQTWLQKFKSPTFSPSKFLFFRVAFSILGIHPAPAKALKKIIRKILMFSGRSKSGRVLRSFQFHEKEISVKTEIQGLKESITIIETSDLPSRYVPQSNYYISNSMQPVKRISEQSWAEVFSCVE